MKKIYYLFIVFIIFCSCTVYAEKHDVQAKYETTYNVPVFKGIIQNKHSSIEVDNKYVLKFSSSVDDIEIVIIKMDNDANNYAKTITNGDENYFLLFFKNGNKLINNEIEVEISDKNKVLNIYSNDGNVVDKSNETIELSSNDYIIGFSNYEEINDGRYIISNANSTIDDIDGLNISSSSMVEVYNYKNQKINQNAKLGTGYRVVVTNDLDIKEYVIVSKGDITGDAKVNLNDVTRLYHYYKGIENMDEIFILAGDVTPNKIINLNDITKIYHYYKKIISNL
jgi:hypothetical protein